MTKYRVYLTNSMSTSVIVDVDDDGVADIDTIENAALDALPPSQGEVHFLDHTWPDSGEWYIEDDGYEEVK